MKKTKVTIYSSKRKLAVNHQRSTPTQQPSLTETRKGGKNTL